MQEAPRAHTNYCNRFINNLVPIVMGFFAGIASGSAMYGLTTIAQNNGFDNPDLLKVGLSASVALGTTSLVTCVVSSFLSNTQANSGETAPTSSPSRTSGARTDAGLVILT